MLFADFIQEPTVARNLGAVSPLGIWEPQDTLDDHALMETAKKRSEQVYGVLDLYVDLSEMSYHNK